MNISKNLKTFYEKLAKAKNKESWEELLNIDGKVILNVEQFSKPESIEISNCYNNPIYFLDKVRIVGNDPNAISCSNFEFNIGTYLAVRNLMNNSNVILALPPQRGKSTIVKAFGLYILLFTTKHIVVKNSIGTIAADIITLYNNLPEYLKIKSVDDIKSRIVPEEERVRYMPGEIGLCIYDGLTTNQVEDIKDVDMKLPIIITTRLSEDTWENKLVPLIRESGEPTKFVQVRYNLFDLGADMELATLYFKECGENLEVFLKDFVL